jgi:hypothetical protein
MADQLCTILLYAHAQVRSLAKPKRVRMVPLLRRWSFVLNVVSSLNAILYQINVSFHFFAKDLESLSAFQLLLHVRAA